MLDWLREWRNRFYRVVDSDNVRVFQAIVYLGMLVSGVYMVAYGAPTTVQLELGDEMHAVWIGMTIIGPLIVTIGDRMVYAGKHRVLHSRKSGGGGRIYWGWYLQAGGDFAVCMVYLTYIIAAFSSAWLQKGIFAAFITTSLMICAVVLVIRDLRRVRAIERL
ncbi:membrane protein [Gordonia phage Biskit]|uniref:Uncharacterized protein n=4 Tax=Emalynvirus troje TaxID=2560511 RepID=A0A2K9VET3_9CAUD|nr:membrane protein [Gordonia phage Troje]AXH45122.1 hypothetical protein SEA_SKETCHMEX_22 [Gordonia phage SketchMex]QDM56301.1 hypothetical protein SEA_SWEATNTEARS_25 [Gordonia phage SweatNTears]QNJ59453.1 membrane protein [Gordonia phage Buttrmlkdreams]QWY84896.1 membrane protein [Gordonia phage MScarn]UVK62063.1 membrane protein [Gordonia phage Biskit]